MSERTDAGNLEFLKSWLLRHRVQVDDWVEATGTATQSGVAVLASSLATRVPTASRDINAVARLKSETLSLWADVHPTLPEMRQMVSACALKIENGLRARAGLEFGLGLVVEDTVFRLVQTPRRQLVGHSLPVWLKSELKLQLKRRIIDCWERPPERDDLFHIWARTVLHAFYDAAGGAVPKRTAATSIGTERPRNDSERSILVDGSPLGSQLLAGLQRFDTEIERQLLPLFGSLRAVWSYVSEICHQIARWTEEAPDPRTARETHDLARAYLVSFLVGCRVRLPSKAMVPVRNVGRLRAADAVSLWLGWRGAALPAPINLGSMWEDVGAPSNLLPAVVADTVRPRPEEGWTQHFLEASAVVRHMCRESRARFIRPCEQQQRIAQQLCDLDFGRPVGPSDGALHELLKSKEAAAGDSLRTLAEKCSAATAVRDLLTWIIEICVVGESTAVALSTNPNKVEVHLSRGRHQLADKVLPRLFDIVDGVSI